MKKCRICGAELEQGKSVCEYCGHSVLNDVEKQSEAKAEKKTNNDTMLKYADFIDAEALYKFALCKLNGIGMDKNEEEAFEAFKKLASYGHFDAMYKLAEMYLSQDPPDNDAAYIWLKIAAESGHEPSRLKLRVLNKEYKPYIGKNSAGMQAENTDNFSATVNSSLHSVVLIESCYMRSRKPLVNKGAGFIIEGGYVITNAHVVGDRPENVSACFEKSIDDKKYELLPLAIRSDLDIAVLKFKGLFAERMEARENLKLRAGLPFYGEEVYTVGNPLGIGFSVSRGIVSCPDREMASRYPKGVESVIQVDITANHGNSGGALLDKQNNVLGMVTFIPGNSAGGITMCVPSKYIVEVLNSLS